MTQLCWWGVQFVCKALSGAECEVVLGDLAESGDSASSALLHVLNLWLRRQVALWMDWRPWLALLGVAGSAGFALSEFLWRLLSSISLQFRTYYRFGVHYENGLPFGQDFAYLSCLLFALLLWLWIGGFVLGALSGKATWITGLLFWFVIADASFLRLFLSGNVILRHSRLLLVDLLARPALSPAVLILPVTIIAMRQGASRRTLPLRRASGALVAVSTLTVLLVWMEGWYATAMQEMSGQPMHGLAWYNRLPLLLLVSWPAWYLLTSAISSERKHAS